MTARTLRTAIAIGLPACAAAALMVATTTPAVAGAVAEPTSAEYAVRWEIKTGGPQTVDDVLKALSKPSGKSKQFTVQYFTVTSPANAPSDFSPILRERATSEKTQLMFKYRGDHAITPPACPLPAPDEVKSEVDVSFTDRARTGRAFSYSCTVKDAKSRPAELAPQPKGCVAEMTRQEIKDEAGELKVEEWRLPDGIAVIEVSREGANTKTAELAFQTQVVEPLVSQGADPVAKGMTQRTTECVPPSAK